MDYSDDEDDDFGMNYESVQQEFGSRGSALPITVVEPLDSRAWLANYAEFEAQKMGRESPATFVEAVVATLETAGLQKQQQVRRSETLVGRLRPPPGASPTRLSSPAQHARAQHARAPRPPRRGSTTRRQTESSTRSNSAAKSTGCGCSW